MLWRAKMIALPGNESAGGVKKPLKILHTGSASRVAEHLRINGDAKL
jgi:hypothetical protein